VSAHVPSGFVREQRHELFSERTKRRRRRVFVTKHRELVSDERVVGNVYSHRLNLLWSPFR
jgi:hypothetical protein